MSNIERYQNLSKKRPQKNYRDGFGDYCCISGFQSVFYDVNRIKTGISHFKLSEDPAMCKKCLQVIKRYRRTGGADKFSKTKKVMVCEFHFNPKQIRVSLGIGRKIYLPGSVPSVFDFEHEEKKKERKSSKPRNNQETSSEFETESEPLILSFGDTSDSVVDFPEDTDNTTPCWKWKFEMWDWVFGVGKQIIEGTKC